MRNSRQTRSKASRVIAGAVNGLSSLRISDTRMPRLNGSVSSKTRSSRSRKGERDDGLSEDAAGDSANSETSGSDVPMASPTGDQHETSEEIGSSSANGFGPMLANGHGESMFPVVSVDSPNDELVPQSPSGAGEVDCLLVGEASLSSVKGNNCAPLSMSASSEALIKATIVDDEDLDAEGESDPDAEGESDPDVVM